MSDESGDVVVEPEVVVLPREDVSAALLSIDRGMVGMGKFFEMSLTGLRVKGRPSLDVCGDFFEALRVFEKSLQFAIGDFLLWTEGMYGEAASQLVDAGDWSESTVRAYRWVSSKVPPATRRPELYWSHHQAVAERSPEEQKLWLERAVTGSNGEMWSVNRLLKELRAAKLIEKRGAGAAEAVQYLVIVEVESEEKQEELCRMLPNLGFHKFSKDPED
jgi:hypothetical protein